MPGIPPTSPNFGAPRYDNNVDPADFATQMNGVTDVFDAKAALKALIPPVGAQLPYVGTTDPPAIDGIAAWMLCKGQELDSTEYPELDALIGGAAPVGQRYAYSGGSAPTAGKFKLPDKQGRTSVGAGTAAGAQGAAAKARGTRDGHETHTLSVSQMPAHQHGGGNHQHSISGSRDASGGFTLTILGAGGFTHITNPSGNIINLEGGGQPHNNMQPYEVDGGYIIRVR